MGQVVAYKCKKCGNKFSKNEGFSRIGTDIYYLKYILIDIFEGRYGEEPKNFIIDNFNEAFIGKDLSNGKPFRLCRSELSRFSSEKMYSVKEVIEFKYIGCASHDSSKKDELPEKFAEELLQILKKQIENENAPNKCPFCGNSDLIKLGGILRFD